MSKNKCICQYLPKLWALFWYENGCLWQVISQGSVATRLRCGGHCDSQFVANFLRNSTMEKFRKSSTSAKVAGKSIEVPFFDSQCRCPWCMYRRTSSRRAIQQLADRLSIYFINRRLCCRYGRQRMGSIQLHSVTEIRVSKSVVSCFHITLCYVSCLHSRCDLTALTFVG